MASPSKILLILGSGGRIGASVASLFGEKGYSVAIAARSLEDNKVNAAGQLELRADFTNADALAPTFEKVKQKFGAPPNVVVYNAGAAHFVPATDPLALTLDDLNQDMLINTGAVLVAAQQAVAGFAQLPASVSKTFIFTGNFLNVEILPAMVGAGMAKSASAHLMKVASEAYKAKGYRFYYADERAANGFAAFRDVSGPNHAEHYSALAEAKEQLPWLQTFVGGQGYKDFSKM